MLALWEFDWTSNDWTGSASTSAASSTSFQGLLLSMWWDTTTPAPSPSPSPSPTPSPAGSPANAGGGHRKKYQRVGEDFWDVRERYLRRFAPSVEKAIKPAEVITKNNETPSTNSATLVPATGRGKGLALDGILMLQRQAAMAALTRAHAAQNAAELQDAMQRAQQLALDISKTKQQYYNRAIALLLLDAF